MGQGNFANNMLLAELDEVISFLEINHRMNLSPAKIDKRPCTGKGTRNPGNPGFWFLRLYFFTNRHCQDRQTPWP